MGTLSASMLLSPKLLKPSVSDDYQPTLLSLPRSTRPPSKSKCSQSISPVMRLFGPAIFEASKLKVLFLGGDEEKTHPGKLPRTYTFTHSDITSQLTLAISQTINNSQIQGWYSKFQRDEVVAEWKKVKGKMSLHVHCHISGGHLLLDLFARLRYYIFSKELPVVMRAFVHGDETLFNNYPQLKDALVWVYFHSNIPEFNKAECWGPLKDAMAHTTSSIDNEHQQQEQEQKEEKEVYSLAQALKKSKIEMPEPCKEACKCCFPSTSLINWSSSHLSNPHQQA